MSKFRPERKAVCFASILKKEVRNERQSRFIALNQPVGFIGLASMGEALTDFLAALGSQTEVDAFLDPDVIDFLVKMEFNGFSPVVMSYEPIKQWSIIPLSADAPLLSRVHFPEDLAPDPEAVAQLKAAIDSEFQRNQSVPGLEFLSDDGS